MPKGFWILKNVLEMELHGFKIGRSKFKPALKEPPISFQKSKAKPKF